MCTVSIVPLAGGGPGAFRFACNRDELRTRRPAQPPAERSFGSRTGLHPVDGDAGGTWVGVNDAGLALSLLNLNPPREDGPPPETGSLSRGAIIPALLQHDCVSAAVAQVLRLDAAAQKPFRLVLADRSERAVVRSDGRAIRLLVREADRSPFMITSSGLGDRLVEPPRRALFDRLFAGSIADPIATQSSFHRTHWPDRGHLSVSMDRPEALTLSQTVITVGQDAIEMSYLAGSPHVLHAAPPADRAAAVVHALRPGRRSRTAG